MAQFVICVILTSVSLIWVALLSKQLSKNKQLKNRVPLCITHKRYKILKDWGYTLQTDFYGN